MFYWTDLIAWPQLESKRILEEGITINPRKPPIFKKLRNEKYLKSPLTSHWFDLKRAAKWIREKKKEKRRSKWNVEKKLIKTDLLFIRAQILYS